MAAYALPPTTGVVTVAPINDPVVRVEVAIGAFAEAFAEYAAPAPPATTNGVLSASATKDPPLPA